MANETYTITASDVTAIVAARTAIVDYVKHAMDLHADAIMREIHLFDSCRKQNPARWAKLCMIKSTMSPGVKLEYNIQVSHMLYTPVVTQSLRTFDDVKAILSQTSYGCACYGKNVKALLAKQSAIASLDPADMTWEGIAHLFKGLKTRSWALALYNANNRVFTLDRHELRGLLRLAGIDVPQEEVSICDGRYKTLASFMLEICDEFYPNFPPLCIQWAVWNEVRHSGKHASHAELAR